MDLTYSSFAGTLDRTISEHSLVSNGQTVVVAVSGGVDSIVLLHYLASRADLRLSLVVAHLNHSLRGEESDRDEQFVADLALQYGLRCERRREDIASQGGSLEEAGREARYRFFAEVARNVGADSVAVGHHLDDQAETVLLRLLRGSGTTGLRGMTHRSADGMYIRPLLDVTRAEIEAYAASRNLPFHTDSSNSDVSFLRNRIRLQLLPTLTEYNPAIAVRLAETASIMAADESVLSAVVGKRWQELCECRDDRVVMNAGVARTDEPGMRLRLYRLSLKMLNGNLRRISYRHLQSIDYLLVGGPPNGSLDLPDGIHVIRSYDTMTFTHKTAVARDMPAELIVRHVGVYQLPAGGAVSISACESTAPAEESGRLEMVVNLGEFPFPWTIRTFAPGDRIVPRGMNGHKKVKDLFIDEKVPRTQRTEIPLFLSGGKLFWVGGLRKGGAAASLSSDVGAVRVELLEFTNDAAMLA